MPFNLTSSLDYLNFCSRFPLLSFLTYVIGQEVTLRNLQNGPGVLPFKIGTARIQESSITIMHFFDLSPLINETTIIGKHLENLKFSVKKYAASHKNDLLNFEMTTTSLLRTVKTKLENLLPSMTKVPRTRRGLINGLGSVFKAVSGNLDASDGERYDKALDSLRSNQNEILNHVKEQICMNVDMVTNFENITRAIKHNEVLMQARITKISDFVNRVNNGETYYHMRDIYDQLINSLDMILELLVEVENSVTFAKLNVFHPSVLPSSALLKQLLKIENEHPHINLPLPVTAQNLHFYENLLSIRCYFSENKIVHLISVPLVLRETFEYFHLYSIPIKQQAHSFQTIVPFKKYLLTCEGYYAYETEPCRRADPQTFICTNVNLKEKGLDDPCEIQLLELKSNGSTCKYQPLHISELQIHPMEENGNWLLITPTTEKIKTKCKTEKIHALTGTYMVTLPQNCSFETQHQKIVNQEYVVSDVAMVQLPSLSPTEFATEPNLEPIHLTDLKLDELQKCEKRMRKTLSEAHGAFTHVWPNVGTTLLYALLIAAAAWISYKKFWKRPVSAPAAPEIQIIPQRTERTIDFSQINISPGNPGISSERGGVM